MHWDLIVGCILGLAFLAALSYRLFENLTTKAKPKSLKPATYAPVASLEMRPVINSFQERTDGIPLSTKLRGFGYAPLFNTDQFTPLSREKLAAAIPYPVPADYLQFLTEFPVTGVFGCIVAVHGIQPGPGTPDAICPIVSLLASCSRADDDLLHSYQNRRAFDLDDNIGPDMLEIGDDSGGNLYFLKLGEPEASVYYWDRESDTLSLIANSFSDFINRIEKTDD